MKPTGTGRIIFWRGGSLWIGRGGEPTDLHSHHAVQITVPLAEGQMRLRRPDGEWRTFDGVIVAAHQPHAFEARGEFVAMLFVEPESRAGRVLHQRSVRDGVSALVDGLRGDEITALAMAYNEKLSDPELATAARAVILKLANAHAAPVTSVDARIERALELLRQRIGGPIQLSDIAAGVYLSPDRFRHLFIQETGVKFRPYVLWLRIEIALAAFAAGKDLTEASQCGGFADSAHFSRTFKRMFGIVPSSFQRE